MSDSEFLMMMLEVDGALTRHGAKVTDVVTVADRLLASAFHNVAEQQPHVDLAALADQTLATIRAHCLEQPDATETTN